MRINGVLALPSTAEKRAHLAGHNLCQALQNCQRLSLTVEVLGSQKL
jgi:hypothetical protein